jgi:hypothetical protein
MKVPFFYMSHTREWEKMIQTSNFHCMRHGPHPIELPFENNENQFQMFEETCIPMDHYKLPIYIYF